MNCTPIMNVMAHKSSLKVSPFRFVTLPPNSRILSVISFFMNSVYLLLFSFEIHMFGQPLEIFPVFLEDFFSFEHIGTEKKFSSIGLILQFQIIFTQTQQYERIVCLSDIVTFAENSSDLP